MKKFTKEEVELLLEVVREELNRSSHLRYGQALWNAAFDLNPELMDSFRGDSSKDFFYYRDNGTAWITFEKYYTEQGEVNVCNYDASKSGIRQSDTAGSS